MKIYLIFNHHINWNERTLHIVLLVMAIIIIILLHLRVLKILVMLSLSLPLQSLPCSSFSNLFSMGINLDFCLWHKLESNIVPPSTMHQLISILLALLFNWTKMVTSIVILLQHLMYGIVVVEWILILLLLLLLHLLNQLSFYYMCYLLTCRLRWSSSCYRSCCHRSCFSSGYHNHCSNCSRSNWCSILFSL